MNRFIVIAGNIGSGKSTLTDLLSRHLQAQPYYEAVEGNPYLDDFYRDMARYSFHLQVYFLSKRFESHRAMAELAGTVVQDRSIYEDAQVFARNLHEQGLMSSRDYQSYQDLYCAMLRFCRPPDLIIYLQASLTTLQERIERRGRDCEKDIPLTYMAQLNELYDRWTRDFQLAPVLTIRADEVDFVRSESDRRYVLKRIDDYLARLVS